jgi:hypothetical protein
MRAMLTPLVVPAAVSNQDFPVKLAHCTNTSTAGNLQWEYNDMAFLIHWSSKLSLYVRPRNRKSTAGVCRSFIGQRSAGASAVDNG